MLWLSQDGETRTGHKRPCRKVNGNTRYTHMRSYHKVVQKTATATHNLSFHNAWVHFDLWGSLFLCSVCVICVMFDLQNTAFSLVFPFLCFCSYFSFFVLPRSDTRCCSYLYHQLQLDLILFSCHFFLVSFVRGMNLSYSKHGELNHAWPHTIDNTPISLSLSLHVSIQKGYSSPSVSVFM